MSSKKTGCLAVSGAIIGIVGLGILVFSVIGMFYSESVMDRNREQYAQWQEKEEAYYADSVKQARYADICNMMDEAEQRGDSLALEELSDSLELYAPPTREGSIGFNIAGAFLFIPALIGFVMAIVGAIMFAVSLGLRKKHK